jgi:cell division protein FtsA
MDKPTCCLEITSSGIKLLIGYVYKKDVFVLHALESTRSMLLKGAVTDQDQMIIAIKELVNSASKTLGLSFDSVILGLPAIDLSIEQARSETITTDTESHVSLFDGSNALAQITKLKTDDTGKKTVADIVPYQYILEKGATFREYPLGKVSKTLAIAADVEIMDSLFVNSLTKCVEGAGLKVEKYVSVTNAAIRYISSFQKSYAEYLYLDFGARLTTIGYAYDNRLIKAETINFGSNDITDALAKKFGLSFEDANRYKEVYGISKNPKFNYATKEGLKVEDIGEAIKKALSTLTDALQSFMLTVDSSARNLFILSGGGADLLGLDSYLANLFQNRVIVFTPTCYGARNKSYTNCVAMLKYYAEYEIKTSPQRPIDLTLTRLNPVFAPADPGGKKENEKVETGIGDEKL